MTTIETPSGIDRKIQILNGISDWVKSLDDPHRADYLLGLVAIPEDKLNRDLYRELVKIGTSEQEFDAALAGVTIGRPDELL